MFDNLREYTMRKSIVFMFSGQGSQYYQMGRELFDSNQIFKEWMLKQDDIAKRLIGESVINHIYGSKKSQLFNQTLFSHPAIFMVEFAMAKVLIQSDITPTYVLGTSLGEFSSAAVAGIIEYEEALEAIIKQAMYLEMFCQEGKMLAIISNSDIYYEEEFLHKQSELVAVNYQSHFVIAGESKNIEKIEKFLSEKKIVYQELPVSFAFHSKLIIQAEESYKDYLKNLVVNNPKVSFCSSVEGKILQKVDSEYFWKIVREPIKFREAIKQLSCIDNNIFLDLGTSNTLSGFTKYILSGTSNSEIYPIMTPFNQDIKNLNNIISNFNNRGGVI